MRFVAVLIGVSAFTTVWLATLNAQTIEVLETRADGSAILQHRQLAFRSNPNAPGAPGIEIDEAARFQVMDGFGASLTDSSATILMELPVAQRDLLMREMFDPSGPLGLSMLRQPIGASDFSAHGDYSYDDSPDGKADPELSHFGTATDGATIFPLLREALHIDPQIRVVALPWSAPAWMKDSHSMHAGSLQTAEIPVYAQYLEHAVEAYAKEGVPVYAMALQNEPLNENPSYPSQHMEPEQEAKLAATLQPLLLAKGRTPVLMGYEHNWDKLDYPERLLKEATRLTPKGAPTLFGGISFHCYAGDESAQMSFLKEHPSTSLWFTECSGTNGSNFGGDLMWNAHHLLLGAPLNGAKSVLLWNLLLDPHGGPHNGGCGNCRALFTIDRHGDNYSVQRNVEYDELAHAAPIRPGAVRLAAMGEKELKSAAYVNPDGTFVLIVLNEELKDRRLDIHWRGKTAEYVAPGRSLLTFHWGSPTPTLVDGTFRISADVKGSRILRAGVGKNQPELVAPRSGVDAECIWTVHRLATGQVEIRNVATAQSLVVTSAGKLGLLSLDGGHVAALSLHSDTVGVCFSSSAKGSCAALSAGATDLKAGILFHLLAPFAEPMVDRKN